MPQAERIVAQIAHTTPHRVRLQALALRGKTKLCRSLGKKLQLATCLRHVEVRSSTGSIVIVCDEGIAVLRKAIDPFISIATTQPEGLPPTRPITAAVKVYTKLQDKMLQATAGRLGVDDTAFVLLCVGAVVQMVRGDISSPASTLLRSALSFAGAQRFSAAD